MAGRNDALVAGSNNWPRLLSDEFQDFLVGMINAIDHPADLARAARVCKDWHLHAIPRLWKGAVPLEDFEDDWKNPNPWKTTNQWKTPNAEVLLEIARTPGRLQLYLPEINYYHCWSKAFDPYDDERVKMEGESEIADYIPNLANWSALKPHAGILGHVPHSIATGQVVQTALPMAMIMLNDRLRAFCQTENRFAAVDLVEAMPTRAPNLGWIKLHRQIGGDDPFQEFGRRMLWLVPRLKSLRYLDLFMPRDGDFEEYHSELMLTLLQKPMDHISLHFMNGIDLEPALDDPIHLNTGLRSLTLRDVEWDGSYNWSRLFSSLIHLQCLELYTDEKLLAGFDVLLTWIAACTELTELRLDPSADETIGTDGLKALSANCPRLRALTLSCPNDDSESRGPSPPPEKFPDEAYDIICTGFPMLESLVILWPGQLSNEQLAALATHSPHIRHIVLETGLDLFREYHLNDDAAVFAEWEILCLNSWTQAARFETSPTHFTLQRVVEEHTEEVVRFLRDWLPNVTRLSEECLWVQDAKDILSSNHVSTSRPATLDVTKFPGAQWKRTKRHTATVEECLWEEITGAVDGN